MHEKEIEKLQAEKEKVERQLAQEQHKIQRLETAPPTMKREIGASGRTGSSPVAQPSRASHRRQRI